MKRYVIGVLNGLSMYRVASVSLGLLWLYAFILSIAGELNYTPLQMLFGAITFGPVVLLSGKLFGYLFGTKTHAESSFITGMILFFIFPPTAEVPGLLMHIAVAVIASATKFILVYKRRHIFNPAAIAAAIASVIGLGYATWWVANPSLILATTLLGAVVVVKTRQYFITSIFIILASLLVLLNMLTNGSNLSGSISLLWSWPIVFLAFYMLTEPLTIAISRKHKIVVALVVAVIFAWPFSIGNFSTSPAFALAVGNLLAFALAKRFTVRLTFKERRQLTPSTYAFTFRLDKPSTWVPGQYIELTLPHSNQDGRGLRRSFSVISISGSDIELGIRFYEPSSSFKRTLLAMPADSIVKATGIYGDFTLPRDTAKPLLFIAGGIGVTPFISFIRSLKQSPSSIVLVYAASSASELAYIDEISKAGIKVLAVLGEAPKGKLVVDYIVSTRINKDILSELVPDIALRQVYVSGPPLFVDNAVVSSRQLGAKSIKTDNFIGY